MSDILVFPEKLKYRVFREPIDLRRSFKGLEDIVYRHLGKYGDGEKIVFFFFNKSRTCYKSLYYDTTTIHIHYAKLKEDAYKLPVFTPDQRTIDLDPVTLMALLQGLNLFCSKSA